MVDYLTKINDYEWSFFLLDDDPEKELDQYFGNKDIVGADFKLKKEANYVKTLFVYFSEELNRDDVNEFFKKLDANPDYTRQFKLIFFILASSSSPSGKDAVNERNLILKHIGKVVLVEISSSIMRRLCCFAVAEDHKEIKGHIDDDLFPTRVKDLIINELHINSFIENWITKMKQFGVIIPSLKLGNPGDLSKAICFISRASALRDRDVTAKETIDVVRTEWKDGFTNWGKNPRSLIPEDWGSPKKIIEQLEFLPQGFIEARTSGIDENDPLKLLNHPVEKRILQLLLDESLSYKELVDFFVEESEIQNVLDTVFIASLEYKGLISKNDKAAKAKKTHNYAIKAVEQSIADMKENFAEIKMKNEQLKIHNAFRWILTVKQEDNRIFNLQESLKKVENAIPRIDNANSEYFRTNVDSPSRYISLIACLDICLYSIDKWLDKVLLCEDYIGKQLKYAENKYKDYENKLKDVQSSLISRGYAFEIDKIDELDKLTKAINSARDYHSNPVKYNKTPDELVDEIFDVLSKKKKGKRPIDDINYQLFWFEDTASDFKDMRHCLFGKQFVDLLLDITTIFKAMEQDMALLIGEVGRIKDDFTPLNTKLNQLDHGGLKISKLLWNELDTRVNKKQAREEVSLLSSDSSHIKITELTDNIKEKSSSFQKQYDDIVACITKLGDIIDFEVRIDKLTKETHRLHEIFLKAVKGIDVHYIDSGVIAMIQKFTADSAEIVPAELLTDLKDKNIIEESFTRIRKAMSEYSTTLSKEKDNLHEEWRKLMEPISRRIEKLASFVNKSQTEFSVNDSYMNRVIKMQDSLVINNIKGTTAEGHLKSVINAMDEIFKELNSHYVVKLKEHSEKIVLDYISYYKNLIHRSGLIDDARSILTSEDARKREIEMTKKIEDNNRGNSLDIDLDKVLEVNNETLDGFRQSLSYEKLNIDEMFALFCKKGMERLYYGKKLLDLLEKRGDQSIRIEMHPKLEKIQEQLAIPLTKEEKVIPLSDLFDTLEKSIKSLWEKLKSLTELSDKSLKILDILLNLDNINTQWIPYLNLETCNETTEDIIDSLAELTKAGLINLAIKT
ncbi:MAG: hypothetical protein ACFFD4_21045 [Candidatus Odinarchaeota archaeon]